MCMDACLEGLGVFLLQENVVIAYESRKFRKHEQSYVLYDLKLDVVLHASKMWSHYLLQKKFISLTYHISLKYFFS